MDYDDFETVIWLLGIVAIITASAMVWGWVGALFAFGAIFVGWVALKQIVRSLAR